MMMVVTCDTTPRCPVACGQCRVRCDNNHVSCGAWARRGECRKNPEYMEIYCSKACSTCSKKENRNCKDLKSGERDNIFALYLGSCFAFLQTVAHGDRGAFARLDLMSAI